MKNNDIMIGKLIRTQRKKDKLTQEELAEKSGLSVNFISSLERLDSQNISIQKLISISDALDVNIVELLKGEQSDISELPLYTQLLIKRMFEMNSEQADKLSKHLLDLIDDLKNS